MIIIITSSEQAMSNIKAGKRFKIVGTYSPAILKKLIPLGISKNTVVEVSRVMGRLVQLQFNSCNICVHYEDLKQLKFEQIL